MPELHEALAARVAGWRVAGYPSKRHPAVAKIFRFTIVHRPLDVTE